MSGNVDLWRVKRRALTGALLLATAAKKHRADKLMTGEQLRDFKTWIYRETAELNAAFQKATETEKRSIVSTVNKAYLQTPSGKPGDFAREFLNEFRELLMREETNVQS